MYLQKRLSHNAPVFRRLRGYAFDPSLATQLETAVVNQVTFRVQWEDLAPGPVGELVEVVDIDPPSACLYAPVDLNDPYLLAQDGLPPSDGDPRFHQQMVYAVAMTTIKHFERALGRPVLWAEREKVQKKGETKSRASAAGKRATGSAAAADDLTDDEIEHFVRRLRIYPHALREANAYYSPTKVALLFGYFPAPANDKAGHFPGGMVFSCLSHDIIAHETTHAILDSMYRRYIEPNHPDVRAFHEAFADIVALFQHFSYPEVLRHQIARTRGDLRGPSLLGELAVEFGRAMGGYGALRSAIGQIDPKTKGWVAIDPDPKAYQTLMKPHERGALLVAAVFDAFLAIYERRTADLLRIASGGTGRLPEGNLHPDLVNRLADEASKSAEHVLTMCIRALDYCPPVEITFGEYLRAIITADSDIVRNDEWGYRIAFIEAFRRRGLYPGDVRTISEESLRWARLADLSEQGQGAIEELAVWLRKEVQPNLRYCETREQLHGLLRKIRKKLNIKLRHGWKEASEMEKLTGLAFSANAAATVRGLRTREDARPRFQVSSIAAIERVGPDGDVINQILIALVQTRDLLTHDGAPMKFRGGCTLLLDLDTQRLRYAIIKPISGPGAERRLARQREFLSGTGDTSLAGAYFGPGADAGEPFALLHRSHDD